MFTNNYAGMNPQDYGRMGDSMLVHMNPREVAGLQSLARSQGTSMTVNPQTGYPEAFNLESLIPMIAGAALTPILGPMAPLVVGGIGALMTGSVEQGLMMGLGAYGGAGLAGSAANLAAPAMAAAAPTAAIAAPAAVGGASGATGLMASAAPIEAAASAFAPSASVGGLGLQAPIITPATATAGSTLIPTTAEAAGLAGSAMGSTGVSATAAPSFIPDIGTASQVTSPFAESTSIANVIDPPMSYGNRVLSGFGKAFESPSSLMNFVGDNKMNLAMSAAPMLLTPEQEEEERRRAMIRPYGYEVDNLSGTAVDPLGTEAERLRGRFVAKEPYYAAKGGLMSLAEGGSASEGSSSTSESSLAESPAQSSMSPAEAEVYRNIFAVQQMAGMPMSMPTSPADSFSGIAGLPNPFTMAPTAPREPVAYTPSMVGSALDTSEKRYGATPTTGSVVGSGSGDFMSSLPLEDTSFAGIMQSEGMPGLFGAIFGPMMEPGYSAASMGRDNSNLREARRIVGYTGDGKPVFLASDATGGVSTGTSRDKFSYDPATGTYTQLAGGGLTTLKAGGRAGRKKISRSDPFYKFGLDLGKVAEEQFAAGGLKEGAFIIPADVISHLGNGSSEAGMKIVQERLKGRPIKGPGDGMSDSIPTTIAGRQPARVANEEAEIPPEVVAALGGGSLEKGAKKLYEMMDKIRQDRTGKKKQAPEVKADRYMPA